MHLGEGALAQKGASAFRSAINVGVLADGFLPPGLPLSRTFQPLPVDMLSVEPWSVGSSDALLLLDYLEARQPARPLLGVTHRPLTDGHGIPIRGISRAGTGLALASCHGLDIEGAQGVLRHELAHAFGLEHCDRWDCALSERPHPMGVEDRPASLCPSCQALWERALEGSP